MNQRDRLRYERRAEVIKALAHPSRILMADALSEGERCVHELTELVGADMSTVSKHLAVMKAVGLVCVEKRGQNVIYRLTCPCLGDFFRCVDAMQRQHVQKLRSACW